MSIRNWILLHRGRFGWIEIKILFTGNWTHFCRLGFCCCYKGLGSRWVECCREKSCTQDFKNWSSCCGESCLGRGIEGFRYSNLDWDPVASRKVWMDRNQIRFTGIQPFWQSGHLLLL